MRQLPPKVLEEIYLKSIIVIYGIVVWGNCSSTMLNSLNPIHDRAARLIHDQDDLHSLNWLPRHTSIKYAYCCSCLMLSNIMFLTTLYLYYFKVWQ